MTSKDIEQAILERQMEINYHENELLGLYEKVEDNEQAIRELKSEIKRLENTVADED